MKFRTAIINPIVAWDITRIRAHVTEPMHSRPEEWPTEGHKVRFRIFDICTYTIPTTAVLVNTRKRECYRLLFLSVGVLLGSLKVVKATGNSPVSRIRGGAKKFLECSILVAFKGTEEFETKGNRIS